MYIVVSWCFRLLWRFSFFVLVSGFWVWWVWLGVRMFRFVDLLGWLVCAAYRLGGALFELRCGLFDLRLVV